MRSIRNAPFLSDFFVVQLVQLDIMEHSAIKDVIVLQTVREELRHLSMPIYNRVNAILADKNRRFYLFANEHHRYLVLSLPRFH